MATETDLAKIRSETDLLRKLAPALSALIAVSVGSEALSDLVHLPPFVKPLVRLVAAGAFLVVLLHYARSWLEPSRAFFLIAAFIACIFVYFGLSLTAHLPGLRQVPLIGAASRVVHPLQSFLLVVGVCSLMVGTYYAGEALLRSNARLNQEIARHQRAEEALRLSEQQFNTIFHHNPAPLAVSTPEQGRLVAVNKRFCEFFGYQPEELIGHTAFELNLWVKPERRREFQEIMRRDGSIEDLEAQVRRKDGAVRDVLGSCRFVKLTGKSEPVVVVMFADITERKRAEATREALLALGSRLSAARSPVEAGRIIFAAADKLWAWDAGSLIIYSPEQDLAYTVLNIDILEGARREVRVTQATAAPTPRVRRIMQEGAELVLREPPFAPLPGAVVFGDTSRLSASLMAVPVRWQGHSVGFLTVQSYTPHAFNEGDLQTLQGLADHCGGALERIQVEAALSRNQAELTAIYEHTPLMQCLVDEEVRIIRANRALSEFSRRPPAELPGLPAGEVIGCRLAREDPRGCGFGSHCATCPLSLAVRNVFATGASVRRVEVHPKIVRQAADTEVVLLLSSARLEVSGRICALLCLEDITTQKKLAEQLRHAQKMEAVGQLAGGVAHDFNNILAAMMMNVSLLGQDAALTPEMREVLVELEQEGARAASLIRQLLMFSRQQLMQVQTLDLNNLLDNLLKMLRRLLGENIDLSFQGTPAQPWIAADPGMMEQVVVNLCVNARDAMPHGGRLILRTHIVEIDAAQAQRTPAAQIGRFACLSVSDSGSGMDEDTLRRLFEPFFTTKDVGKGTGLGLATVHGIVAQHSGWIEVESAVGKGTSFRVYLPLGTRAVKALDEEGEGPLPTGGETILLVEDDTIVRRVMARLLQRLGYTVLEAGNGVEAGEQWDKHEASIQLLFTDMVMPEGLTGLELAAKLRAIRPDLRVIISSGYSVDLLGFTDQTAEFITVLPKPYDTMKLAKTVRHALDRKA